MFRRTILSILGLVCAANLCGEETAELWCGSTLKVAQCNQWTLVLEPELRFEDNVRQLTHYNTAVLGLCKLSKTSTFGLGYRYLLQRSPGTEFEPENRGIIQISNQVPFWDDTFTFKTRQRLELRRKPGESWANLRTRHQIGIVYRLPKRCFFIDELFSQNELFVDIKQGRIVQNRWMPIGIIHHVNQRSAIKVAYLNRHRRSNDQWNVSHAAYLWFDYQLYAKNPS